MCTIRFIATSQLFSAVSWIHMCMCIPFVYACVCVSRCNMCVLVCSGQGMKETLRNWMVRERPGLNFYCWPCIHYKNWIPLSGFYSTVYETHTWTSSGPCGLKDTTTKARLLLQHSPSNWEHLPQDFPDGKNKNAYSTLSWQHLKG